MSQSIYKYGKNEYFTEALKLLRRGSARSLVSSVLESLYWDDEVNVLKKDVMLCLDKYVWTIPIPVKDKHIKLYDDANLDLASIDRSIAFYVRLDVYNSMPLGAEGNLAFRKELDNYCYGFNLEEDHA